MEQCEKAISVALNLPDEFSDDRTLYKEAFALGCQIGKPVYDMFYLILARRNNGLLTKQKPPNHFSNHRSRLRIKNLFFVRQHWRQFRIFAGQGICSRVQRFLQARRVGAASLALFEPGFLFLF